MIFVTVGAQMPFDRLIRSVDDWAGSHRGADVFAQIGDTTYRPRNIRWTAQLNPNEFRATAQAADVIIAHAGMGSILTALELGKPIVVMPRRGTLRETRNDHQFATARQLGREGLVIVAMDERELRVQLDTKLNCLEPVEQINDRASDPLLATVSDFVNGSRGAMADGVICFGGVDWWYHNRGHYDIQMMREFGRVMPVLYVNSIGMRTPSVGEGAVFVRRALRKIQSWRRGLKRVRENFAVLSPVSVPRFHGTAVGDWLLAGQVREAAAWMGIERPVVWVACPPAAEVLDQIPRAGLVYQRTDRFEHYPGVNAHRIRGYDLALKERADVTLFCSSSVYEEEKGECRRAAFVDHGVDYDMFAAAGQSPAEPADVKEIPRPRIGFVGGIDAHTFDPELFANVARAMPECSFVLVGDCTLPPDWCDLKNVHRLGKRPYEQVASYMAACDVLIMPWNRSPWIKACNPVKLKEYLAVGRPVVTTPFDELKRYEGFVSIADDAEGFVAAIRGALEAPCDAAALRRRVQMQTWSAKAGAAAMELEAAGVRLAGRAGLVTEPAAAPPEAPQAEPSAPARATAAAPGRLGRAYWRVSHLVGAAMLAAAGIVATKDAWLDIFRLASRDEESSHIWLVLPVAAWLAWVRRDRLKLCWRTGTLIGPAIIAIGWLLYALGDTHLIQSFWHLGAIVIAIGCIVSILGRDALIRLLPAFAVLVFLVPVPGLIRQQIAMPLQTVSAQATQSILTLLGTETSRTGNVLLINGVEVGIAEACNGLRMVFSLALVCFLYAFGMSRGVALRVVILAISPLVAIAANVVRLVPTVWLYGYADPATADGFHDISGWLMMPVTLLAMIGAGAAIGWVCRPSATVTEPRATAELAIS